MTEENFVNPIDRVCDRFIDQLRNREIQIDAVAAKKESCEFTDQQDTTLLHVLAYSIDNYERHVADPFVAQKNADDLMHWINIAYLCNVVKDGSVLNQMIEQRDKRIAGLEQEDLENKQEIARLEHENMKRLETISNLQGRLEQCQEDYEKLSKSWSGVGEVQR